MRERLDEEARIGNGEAYVPLFFAPGQACQFDWSHEIVLINGVTVTVKVAHVRTARGGNWQVSNVRNVLARWERCLPKMLDTREVDQLPKSERVRFSPGNQATS